MAITKRKEDNLVESNLSSGKVLTDVKPQVIDKKPQEEHKDTRLVVSEKKSFLATTIEELKKVEWPKFSYVRNWSAVILLFTAVFSISLGFFDHVFTAGINFADCTSPQGKKTELNTCLNQFTEEITYRR